MALIALAVAPSSASADSSLVGQWHFDAGSGTVAADSSGLGNDGTISGGAAWVPGKFGSALSFNGTTAVVDVPDSTSLEPASAITVSAWVEEKGTPGSYRYILAKGENGCLSASYGLYTGANGGLAFYVYNGEGNSYVISPNAGSGVWDGTWHLAVGVYDGTSVRLYLDGAQVGSGAARSGPIPYRNASSNDLFIGGYPGAQNITGCGAGSFRGLIDEVNIWSQALSASEVSALMSAPTAGGSPGGAQTPPGGSGSTPGSGPGGKPQSAPKIESFKVSGASVARTGGGATITYTLSRAANLSFKVLVSEPGTKQGRRCVKRSHTSAGARARRCTRVVTLARFSGRGHAGSNRLRFGAGVWRKLAAGRYRLEVTPSANGQTGKTVTAPFTVHR
jgi:hypothetical protein